jgi:hypothetical protein
MAEHSGLNALHHVMGAIGSLNWLTTSLAVKQTRIERLDGNVCDLGGARIATARKTSLSFTS